MYTKVAVIRDPAAPVGIAATMFLNCPCGGRPAVDYPDGEPVRCKCGVLYRADGWIVKEEPQNVRLS